VVGESFFLREPQKKVVLSLFGSEAGETRSLLLVKRGIPGFHRFQTLLELF
jgi:hypothetical protein